MKFKRFPKKQDQYLVCSSKKAFDSRLFKELKIQCSAKSSVFTRILNSKISFYLKYFSQETINTPSNQKDFLGFRKPNKLILFEMGDSFIQVWKKTENEQWKSEEFLGYPLITEYSLNEIIIKKELIHLALSSHTTAHNERPHGDFTHFNILISDKNDIRFIDHADHAHLIINDLFYFYSYLNFCFDRCSTVSKNETEKSMSIIRQLIIPLIRPEWKDEFNNQDSSSIPFWGIPKHNKTEFLENFKSSILSFIHS